MNTQSLHAYAYRDIYEQYVSEASFLWVMRSIAVNQPHYKVVDIKRIEARVQAHLTGLMTSMDMAWPLCEEALEQHSPGEVFTAAIIAFKSHDRLKIQKVVEAGLVSHASTKALLSAIAWLPSEISHPWIQRFLVSKHIDHRYLAIFLCSMRRENPGDFLTKFLQSDDCLQHEKLQVRCLRLIGELKRHDLVPALNRALQSDNESIAFWAAWSAILLGNKDLVQKMESHLFRESIYHDRALDVAFRVLPVSEARSWITQLAADPQHTRSVIKATGILGDLQAVNWLIEKMKDIAYARLAGEAFSQITGLNLEQNELQAMPPQNYVPMPNDDASDTQVAMEEDENLLWPNAALVAASWEQSSHQFIKGQRYLLGKEINASNVSHHLQQAYQRQRHAAAMELAVGAASHILQNTRAKVTQA